MLSIPQGAQTPDDRNYLGCPVLGESCTCRGKKLKLLQQLLLTFLQNALAQLLLGSQLALQP